MLNQILLAVIQSITEFLPISSSGHLALISKITPNLKADLFFFTILHLASLIAVLIFTRKEIAQLLSFNKKYYKIWLYLIIATIPAVLFGYFFKSTVESAFSSLLLIGLAFIFTGIVLYLTKYATRDSKLNIKNSIIIGLFQAFALFPGISRSGMTISAARFSGVEREKAAKFSFLLFIPLVIGATILESGKAYFSPALAVSFIICLLLSLFFLQLLLLVIKKGKFWMFSTYCFLIGILTLIFHFF